MYRPWVVGLALVFTNPLPFVRADEPLPTLAGPTQGTTYRVRFGQALTDVSLSELRSEIEVLLAQTDHQMSTYHDDTDLMRFNRSSSCEWFAVPPDLVTVV